MLESSFKTNLNILLVLMKSSVPNLFRILVVFPLVHHVVVRVIGKLKFVSFFPLDI
jgi:hypothetical protein